ncbi:MAG: hypothetical protein H2069_03140 [Legionella sp.]|nr:hypothetical protein [Legionella sp.]
MQTKRQLSELIEKTDLTLKKNKNMLAAYEAPIKNFAAKHHSVVYLFLMSGLVLGSVASKKFNFHPHYLRFKRYGLWFWRAFSTLV